jgi:hypothetical protein
MGTTTMPNGQSHVMTYGGFRQLVRMGKEQASTDLDDVS